MIKVQVTYFSKERKPLACIIKCESVEDFQKKQREYLREAIIKICNQKRWDNTSVLASYGYGNPKARVVKE